MSGNNAIIEDRIRKESLARTAKARRRLPVEHFRCDKGHGVLSRQACAARWPQFNGRRLRPEGRTGRECTGCQIGEAHSKGIVHPAAPAVPAPIPRVA